jgi:hypothetical protein
MGIAIRTGVHPITAVDLVLGGGVVLISCMMGGWLARFSRAANQFWQGPFIRGDDTRPG